MDASLKKILKAVTLELRHLLEGQYDSEGKWQPGDLEQRLAAIGVRRDRESVSVDELGHLPDEDKHARRVVDAYVQLHEEADVPRTEAVAEFVRETAYTWANRVLALRCMEARELIDEVILQKEVYGGRSLEHHRLAQREPEHCTGEDDGRFVMLQRMFAKQAKHLPVLFDPQSPGVALRPSPAVLKQCIALLSGTLTVRSHDPATGEVFKAPDSLGWAYQYWNTDEKDRVFEKVRTQKGAKIEGADIVPATQLYTESYMVQFLVQNSLGATWMGMRPDSKLYEEWEYYVRDADRAPVESKPVRKLTFLDPACGSGHFLLEAFDLLYAMYEEEGELTEPDVICDAILTQNLYGIDIDARSIQIAEVVLWMKAAERTFDYEGVPTNLVATVSSHLKGTHWDEFLASFDKEPSVARVLQKFGESMAHINELGSLARPNEDLKKIIAEEHAVWEQQVRQQKEANFLFPEMREEALKGTLAFTEISDVEFGDRLFYRVRSALDAFSQQASEEDRLGDQLIAYEARAGITLFETLRQRYDLVVANPPYMGGKNIGNRLKQYIDKHYPSATTDLYATFILRSLSLCNNRGFVAMVTQHSWLFLKSFADLRNSGTTPPEGVLQRATLELLAHLGEYAFHDPSAAGAFVAMFTLRPDPPAEDHQITATRLVAYKTPGKKAEVLRKLCTTGHFIRSRQRDFLNVDESPVCYWLPDALLKKLAKTPLKDFAEVCQGLATSDDPRFVRYFWEIPIQMCETLDGSLRWAILEKGGGHCRWKGNQFWLVDWEHDGFRLKQTTIERYGNAGKRIYGERFYFQDGWSYSVTARGSLGVRRIRSSILSTQGSGIFSAEGHPVGAICNSRIGSVILRALTPQIYFREGYVGRIPFPLADRRDICDLEDSCVTLKTQLLRFEPTERDFDASLFLSHPPFQQDDYTQAEAAILAVLEGYLEHSVQEALGINSTDYRSLLHEVGVPVAWEALIEGHDTLPTSDRVTIPECILQWHRGLPRRSLSDDELPQLLDTLSTPSVNVSKDITEEEDSAGSLPIPSGSRIEAIASATRVHPVSLFWLGQLQDNGDNSGAQNADADRIASWMETATLQLFGHEWPTNTEASPTNVDRDGVIPITEGTGESTVAERLRTLFQSLYGKGASQAYERLVMEVFGKSMEQWIEVDLFGFHSKQFRRRPVLWHISSRAPGRRGSGVFSCLLHCHALDSDTLPKIRNSYVANLRRSFETELRGIANVPIEARTDRQESRRQTLVDYIEELEAFQDRLSRTIESGFESELLARTVSDEPLDVWSGDGDKAPESHEELFQRESHYDPCLDDGVRVNISALQLGDLLEGDVLTTRDARKALSDRTRWRSIERRWCREELLIAPRWWNIHKGG